MDLKFQSVPALDLALVVVVRVAAVQVAGDGHDDAGLAG